MRCACLILLAVATATAVETTSAALWAEYAANPDAHPLLPNCSYAGYGFGEKPLPEPAVVADVTACGAAKDGSADATAAFAEAIAKAKAAGGGAVLVPAGSYRIDGMIRLTADGVVLRGEGPDKTTLVFQRPLRDVIGAMSGKGNSQWSWSGGLVWMSPADTFTDTGRIAGDNGIEAWERWRAGARLGDVTAPAKRGERTVAIDAAAAGSLKPGQLVLMTWANPADHSLLLHMAGHPLMETYDWKGKAGGLTRQAVWTWPVEIEAVADGTATLRQPLRIDIRPEWTVGFHAVAGVLTGAGIEKLTIAMTGRKPVPHLADPGFNGVYLNRCTHCFVRDVTIRDCDNGVIHAAAKNTTVTGLRMEGGQHHHATALRVGSHDNLITDFVIASQPKHGINTENLSTGNVWRRGTMQHGTFDSHRAMSFDLIRTDITIVNDGTPGGAGDAGPFLGAHCVHWNIRLSGKGEFVNHPQSMSLGALVGMQGPREDGPGWAMPTGDKGVAIADAGVVPAIADLYLAQLDLRLKSRPAGPIAQKPGGRPVAAPSAGKVSAATIRSFDERLATRVREALVGGAHPRFACALAGGNAEVEAIDAKDGLALRVRGASLTVALATLALGERAALAVAVASDATPTDQALVGFYLLAAGKTADGEARLTRAGDEAATVRAAFQKP